jgi:hypothetical protein
MTRLKPLALLTALLGLLACSALPALAIPTATLPPPTTDATLAHNHLKWQSQHITHYRFSLDVRCFCGFTGQMPLTIEVRDGQLVSETDKTGQPVGAQFKDAFDKYDTIEKLFALLDAAKNGGADRVDIAYDPQYGFPQSAYIDYMANATDDENSLTVTHFEILK